jgi:hypothetical protein
MRRAIEVFTFLGAAVTATDGVTAARVAAVAAVAAVGDAESVTKTGVSSVGAAIATHTAVTGAWSTFFIQVWIDGATDGDGEGRATRDEARQRITTSGRSVLGRNIARAVATGTGSALGGTTSTTCGAHATSARAGAACGSSTDGHATFDVAARNAAIACCRRTADADCTGANAAVGRGVSTITLGAISTCATIATIARVGLAGRGISAVATIGISSGILGIVNQGACGSVTAVASVRITSVSVAAITRVAT